MTERDTQSPYKRRIIEIAVQNDAISPSDKTGMFSGMNNPLSGARPFSKASAKLAGFAFLLVE